jgi:hypothetical protein
MLTLSNRQKSEKLGASFVTQEGRGGPMIGQLLANAFAKTLNL